MRLRLSLNIGILRCYREFATLYRSKSADFSDFRRNEVAANFTRSVLELNPKAASVVVLSDTRDDLELAAAVDDGSVSHNWYTTAWHHEARFAGPTSPNEIEAVAP